MNITVDIDDQVAEKVSKIAIEKNTTLTAMVQKYLTVFRAVNNFILVGKDKCTPAMRLGITRKPLRYEDILWPGEQIPRPRRSRRRGLRTAA